MNEATALPDDFPAFLMHSDADTPIPTWTQVTRSTESINTDFVAQLSLIVSGAEDERAAVEIWVCWPGNYRRSIALIVDKICHEGGLTRSGQYEASRGMEGSSLAAKRLSRPRRCSRCKVRPRRYVHQMRLPRRFARSVGTVEP
jgi:hypothetical protein